ncbi:TetR/AcrR family transcriptional regulator [Dyella sp. Tek66A03]|uniref:TetR/AcrR family transcriptional regulator n=1 Tax=Dyella sp. Tek66A03 TaxID=3458298 RepID=UPI00403E9302
MATDQPLKVVGEKVAPSSEALPAREPQQARGRRRVEAILDAAAAIVITDGLASLTMHRITRRAKTSIGSMYHFFPDRESVLRALMERHIHAIRAITERLDALPRDSWELATPQAVIDLLLMPYLEYLWKHKDFTPVSFAVQMFEDTADVTNLLKKILAIRLPSTSTIAQEDFASVLYSMGAGMLHIGAHIDSPRSDVLIRETPRALAAYLALIEADENQRSTRSGRSSRHPQVK